MKKFYTEQEFVEVYKSEKEKIILYLLKFVKNKVDAEDICNEAFQKAWTRILQEQKSEIENLKSYIYKAARNISVTFLKMKNRFPINENFLEENLKGCSESDFSEENFNNLMENEVNESLICNANNLCEALEKLPAEQRRCIELFFFDKKSYKEIAEITGYSEKNVKSYMQNGKRNLGNLLKPFLENE